VSACWPAGAYSAHNYPITAHLRFLFEKIRLELRQYFFEDDKNGLPFPRHKRAIVYQRAKGALDKRPFERVVAPLNRAPRNPLLVSSSQAG
jgi:hypothetical protein